MTRGRFLSFEGLEGVGKTTSIGMVEALLRKAGVEVVVTREPGGTPLAESLRDLVLGGAEEPVSDMTELLVMFAARSQSVAEVIRPALARGDWVLCDRFTDATLAYQGYARGMSLERIRTLARWVHGDLKPDRTFLLQASAAIARQRLAGRTGAPDRIEREHDEFFARAGRGYAALAAAEPNRFVRIDTSGDLATVETQLRAALAPLLHDAARPVA